MAEALSWLTDEDRAVISGQGRWYVQTDVAKAWGISRETVRVIVRDIDPADEWPELSEARTSPASLREDVMILVARGHTDAEVAGLLGLGRNTVERWRKADR